MDTKQRRKDNPTRRPLQHQNIFKVKDMPGYIGRWVNETMGRVDAFLEAGWEVVTDHDADISTNLVQDATKMGASVIRRVVNRGTGADCQTAILMRIKKEWYDADQAEAQALADDVDQTIRNQAPNGCYVKEASLVYKQVE